MRLPNIYKPYIKNEPIFKGNSDQLHLFKALVEELSTCKLTPISKQILGLATKTKSPRANTSAVIGMCSATIIKHRNPKLNLVQKIIAMMM